MADLISPIQIRAVRAMLDWAMMDLAKASGLSVSTVKRFEGGDAHLVSADAVAMMRDAVEARGVSFLECDGSGPGVRFRPL